MSSVKQLLVLAAALVLVGLVLYLAYTSRPQTPAQSPRLAGLAWLPAEVGLVGGVDLAGLREQDWLLEMMRHATGEVAAAPDYQAFVEATGFDYSRDLDRVWFGVFRVGARSVWTGVAEGRFARHKIVAYAQEQGATTSRHQGLEIYQVRSRAQTSGPPESGQLERNFAFAFLDDTHLAFASDPERAAMIVDCWAGRVPAVGSDGPRRAELEQVAAGWQAWVVNEPAKWEPPGFGQHESGPALGAVVTQMALGLRVGEEGVELAGEARCHEAAQAERLRDNLNLLLLAGRMALGRQQNRGAQALAEALDNLTLTQRDNTLRVRWLLPPETLAALLDVPAPVSSRP